MRTLAVVDYGMGNLHSVAKALERVSTQHRVVVTHDEKELRAAERIVFPGQGAIGDAMANLKHYNLIDLLRELVKSKPFFGMCLGLQALMTHSDEDGGFDGLDILPGQVQHFRGHFATNKISAHLKIPHMGWNQVYQQVHNMDELEVSSARYSQLNQCTHGSHPLWKGIADGSRFYFVHSYFVVPQNTSDTAGVCDYGGRFVCAAARDNLFAVQFHPEKSHGNGLRLLQNFVNWNV